MVQVVIYPKQAAALTGNSYEAGKRLLQRIRVQLRKPARSYVSVREFCAYTHLPEAEVLRALGSASPTGLAPSSLPAKA